MQRVRAKLTGVHFLVPQNTGSPVEAYKRLQFNIPLKPYKKVPYMKDLPDVLLPIFWIEESVSLNATYVNQLKDFFKIMKIMDVVKWVVLVGSMLGMGTGGFLYFKQGSAVNITPVRKVNPSNGNSKTTSVISLVHQNSMNGNGTEDNSTRAFGRQFDRY